MKEALYYMVVNPNRKRVQCFLCPRECVIENNKRGTCKVRQNIEGKLYARTYEEFSSVGLDPIEKKPLYHFYPGSKIFSVGT
ncbi:MAG: AmmeMemoRadiSam system radical SAM enzyme, partial [bacterium]